MNAWRRFADLWSGARLFALIEPGRRRPGPDRFEDGDADARTTTDLADLADDDGFAADTDLLVFFVDSEPRGARIDKRS